MRRVLIPIGVTRPKTYIRGSFSGDLHSAGTSCLPGNRDIGNPEHNIASISARSQSANVTSEGRRSISPEIILAPNSRNRAALCLEDSSKDTLLKDSGVDAHKEANTTSGHGFSIKEPIVALDRIEIDDHELNFEGRPE